MRVPQAVVARYEKAKNQLTGYLRNCHVNFHQEIVVKQASQLEAQVMEFMNKTTPAPVGARRNSTSKLGPLRHNSIEYTQLMTDYHNYLKNTTTKGDREATVIHIKTRDRIRRMSMENNPQVEVCCLHVTHICQPLKSSVQDADLEQNMLRSLHQQTEKSKGRLRKDSISSQATHLNNSTSQTQGRCPETKL